MPPREPANDGALLAVECLLMLAILAFLAGAHYVTPPNVTGVPTEMTAVECRDTACDTGG